VKEVRQRKKERKKERKKKERKKEKRKKERKKEKRKKERTINGCRHRLVFVTCPYTNSNAGMLPGAHV
jgi:predicted RNA polymerase sigma factor